MSLLTTTQTGPVVAKRCSTIVSPCMIAYFAVDYMFAWIPCTLFMSFPMIFLSPCVGAFHGITESIQVIWHNISAGETIRGVWWTKQGKLHAEHPEDVQVLTSSVVSAYKAAGKQ